MGGGVPKKGAFEEEWGRLGETEYTNKEITLTKVLPQRKRGPNGVYLWYTRKGAKGTTQGEDNMKGPKGAFRNSSRRE